MKLRLFQNIILVEQYHPPMFRHDDGHYSNQKHVCQPKLQYFNEAENEWQNVEIVQEVSYQPHGDNTPMAKAIQSGAKIIA